MASWHLRHHGRSLALAALCLPARAQAALFGVAAATLGLLLIGIHNAWDSVTHLVAGNFDVDDADSQ